MLQYGSKLVEAMRSWLTDCVWADMDEDDIACLPDEQVVKGVQRHYEGGIRQFIADGEEV